MDFNFDRPIDRRGTDSLKWGRYTGRDVLPMWVADMDFASPPAVLEALHRRVDHGIFGYAQPTDDAVAAVVEALARDHDWTIHPEWLVWLPGLVSGINMACRLATEDDASVVTCTPAYPPFLRAPGHAGRRLTRIPMAESDTRWEVDFERLDSETPADARVLLLCNPHNPTGRVFNRAELERLAELAARRDWIVCSDEIHCGLVLEPGLRHIPFAALSPAAAERSITLMAPSKTYNIAGLACAFAVVPDPEMRRSFRRAGGEIVPPVNALGFAACAAAYREGGAWRAAALDYLRANRDAVGAAVAGLRGFAWKPPEATFLAWLDVRAAGLDDPQRLFERAGVGLQAGAEFGQPGFLRLNFGCPRATLDEAFARMRRALESLGT